MANPMNRQARHGKGKWVNFGELSHQRAAEMYARINGCGELGPLIVETREEGSDVVFRHRVSSERVFRVDCLRGEK